MKKQLFTFLIYLYCGISYSQNDSSTNSKSENRFFFPDTVSLGFGWGQDYGGSGGNLLYYPQKNIGLFLGAGYAIAGFGYNAGLKLRPLTKKYHSRLVPYVLFMYGFHTAVYVEGAKQYDKLFYGFTAGFGCDILKKTPKKGMFSIGFLFPFRGTEPFDYARELRTNHGVVFKNTPEDFGFTIGYRFRLR